MIRKHLPAVLITVMLFSFTAITSANSGDTWQSAARQTIRTIRTSNNTSFSRVSSSGSSKSFAIVVGQDSYPRRPLTTCVNDAKIMGYILKTQMKIPSSNIKLLLNRSVSKYLLKELFRQISLKSRPEDFVAFYYSGHGVRVRSRDGRVTAALYLIDGNVISADELASWVSMIKGKVLLMFDSCYSGAMIRGNSSASTSDYNENTQTPPSGDMWKSVQYSGNSVLRNVNYLASSSANQLSYTINRAGYSRFTFYFQKAILEGSGDANRDGKISLHEAFNWTKIKLAKLARLYRKYQTPVIYGTSINSIIMNKDVRSSVRIHTAPLPSIAARPNPPQTASPRPTAPAQAGTQNRSDDSWASGTIGGRPAVQGETVRRNSTGSDAWEYSRRVRSRPRIAERTSDSWIINRHRYQGRSPEDAWEMNGVGKFINKITSN